MGRLGPFYLSTSSVQASFYLHAWSCHGGKTAHPSALLRAGEAERKKEVSVLDKQK